MFQKISPFENVTFILFEVFDDVKKALNHSLNWFIPVNLHLNSNKRKYVILTMPNVKQIGTKLTLRNLIRL